MARHEVIRTFEEVRKKSAKVRKENEVGYIWKQGFAVGTDYDEAIQNATLLARTQQNLKGPVLSSEIIQTADHEANGEFLVSLTFGKEVASNGSTDH